MKDFSHILIMTDLDGTFFGPHASLVRRNLDAVERFKARGGSFTFATGRTWHNLIVPVPDPSGIVNAPLSLGNGCSFFDAERGVPIRDFFLPEEFAVKAAVFIKTHFPSAGLRISRSSGFMLQKDDIRSLSGISAVAPEYLLFRPYCEWSGSDWYKIIVIGEPELLADVRSAILCEVGGEGTEFEFDRPGTHLLELHPVGCGKGSMIKMYRDFFKEKGIRDITVCAAGDFDNDIEMLKSADFPVCPSNAADSVRSICRQIFCHCKDGAIADLIGFIEEKDGILC